MSKTVGDFIPGDLISVQLAPKRWENLTLNGRKSRLDLKTFKWSYDPKNCVVGNGNICYNVHIETPAKLVKRFRR